MCKTYPQRWTIFLTEYDDDYDEHNEHNNYDDLMTMMTDGLWLMSDD